MLFQIDTNLKEFRRLKEKNIYFNNKYGDIADTLDYHFESIVNSFIVMERMCADGAHVRRLSNGPMESLNRITQDMRRNGRGFEISST